MLRGIYTSASGMLANQATLDVTANNLANVNTAGYKKDDVVYREFPKYLELRLKDNVWLTTGGSIDLRPQVGKLGTGVTVDAIVVDHNQGPLQFTENRFDMALFGQGMFAVQTRGGERYTRDGSFVMNSEGYLTNHQGQIILGTDNNPIKVGNQPFAVNELGEIYAYNGAGTEQKLGQLKIVRFPEKNGLRKIGENLFYATKESGTPEVVNGNNVIVRQGYIERSNVNVVNAMVKMIEVNRAYEANSRVIQSQDSALGQVINQVGSR